MILAHNNQKAKTDSSTLGAVGAIALIVSVFAFLAAPVYAHLAGRSFEKTIDGKLIDIGSSEEDIIAGAPVSLDFRLFDAERIAEVPFTSVWVRISRDKNNFYAGNIAKARIGPTTLLYQFAEPGVYTLSVRFQNETAGSVETTFAIAVGEGSAPPAISRMRAYGAAGGAVGLGLVIGVVLMYASGYRKKASRREP